MAIARKKKKLNNQAALVTQLQSARSLVASTIQDRKGVYKKLLEDAQKDKVERFIKNHDKPVRELIKIHNRIKRFLDRVGYNDESQV